jgi:plastocyanin
MAMEIRRIVCALPVLIVAGLLALSGCGGGASSGGSSGGSSSSGAQNLHFTIIGSDDATLVGPDGKKHDTYLPSSAKVKVDTPIQVTVDNKDDVPHSFTIKELNIDQVVNGNKSITFTLNISNPGTYRFFCRIPCDADADGWAMQADTNGPSKDGFMAGYITASS